MLIAQIKISNSISLQKRCCFLDVCQRIRPPDTPFQQMKDEMDEELEKQEEEYGEIKDKKIVGKDSVVQYLKDYRDSLQEMVDNYKDVF